MRPTDNAAVTELWRSTVWTCTVQLLTLVACLWAFLSASVTTPHLFVIPVLARFSLYCYPVNAKNTNQHHLFYFWHSGCFYDFICLKSTKYNSHTLIHADGLPCARSALGRKLLILKRYVTAIFRSQYHCWSKAAPMPILLHPKLIVFHRKPRHFWQHLPLL